jgi:serine O-acetyltransferase
VPILERIREDIRTVFAKDPAARNMLEVITCYPGLHTIWAHRIAHSLWRHGFRYPARLLSHVSRFLTGIEIHPGAHIGRRFFIDHGMGVVIGETANIGDDVLMYQGVVLGGTSNVKGKRHPTIGHGAVIGSGSIILGPITVGDGARVGAGSVVVKSIPAGMTVVGVPARITGPKSPVDAKTQLSHGLLPDPGFHVLTELMVRQDAMEQRMRHLERALDTFGIGSGVPEAPISSDDEETVVQLTTALRSVLDPEAGINIVDLGLIGEIVVTERSVEIRMKATCIACPVAEVLMGMVQRRAEEAVQGSRIESVRVVVMNGVSDDLSGRNEQQEKRNG